MVDDHHDGASRLRRALLATCAAVTLFWLLVVLLWNDGPFAFTFDDAYYYTGIARNLVAGHGSTFDQLNATNGYHPLWMAVCMVPFELGLDGLDAVRALLAFEVVVGWGLTTALVALVVSRFADHDTPMATIGLTAVFALVTLNPFVVKAVVNGLESGIAAPVYALVLWLATTGDGEMLRETGRAGAAGSGRTRRLLMGALLAIAFLARTDAILLIGCLGCWNLAELGRGVRGERAAPVTRLLLSMVELFGPSVIVVALYLVLNARAFGTPLQISGLVKRAPLDATTVVTFIVFVLVASGIGWHAFRRVHGRRPRRSPRFDSAGAFALRTGWFAAFGVLVIGYYNVLQTQQWLWYYAPLVVYLVILFLLAVNDVLLVAATSTPSPSTRTLAPIVAVFVLPLLIGLVVGWRSFADPTLLSIQRANRDAGVWMRANTPADAVFASWDAGAVGYFSHRRVINIDGVVNSREYYDAQLQGTVPEFLRCRSLGFVVNHGDAADGDDPDIRKLIADVYGPAAAEQAQVRHRVVFDYSGTSNTGGFETSGQRPMSVRVYEIPASSRGARPTDRCPS